MTIERISWETRILVEADYGAIAWTLLTEQIKINLKKTSTQTNKNNKNGVKRKRAMAMQMSKILHERPRQQDTRPEDTKKINTPSRRNKDSVPRNQMAERHTHQQGQSIPRQHQKQGSGRETHQANDSR